MKRNAKEVKFLGMHYIRVGQIALLKFLGVILFERVGSIWRAIPGFPPVPDDGASPMQGIETPTPTDNLPAGEPA